MVDNRSAGFFGVGGAFNFKSGDISGTAARTQDDKMGQGTEYFAMGNDEEEQQQSTGPYVDRSSQLRATLNSLAMMNVASVLNERKRLEILDELEKSNDSSDSNEEKKEKDDLDEEFLDDMSDDKDDEEFEYY